MISESPWFYNMRNIKTQNIDVANKKIMIMLNLICGMIHICLKSVLPGKS